MLKVTQMLYNSSVSTNVLYSTRSEFAVYTLLDFSVRVFFTFPFHQMGADLTVASRRRGVISPSIYHQLD